MKKTFHTFSYDEITNQNYTGIPLSSRIQETVHVGKDVKEKRNPHTLLVEM